MKRGNIKLDLSGLDNYKSKREPSLERTFNEDVVRRQGSESIQQLSSSLESMLSSPKLSPKLSPRLPKLKRVTPKISLNIKPKEDDRTPRIDKLKFKPTLELTQSQRRVSKDTLIEDARLLSVLKGLSPEVNNLEKYEKIDRPLASGAFGVVNFYRKKDNPNDKLYIIKRISYIRGQDGEYNDDEKLGMYKRLINEILTLKRLENENCKDENKVDLCFIETFSDNTNIYIVTQFKNDTTSLDEYMKTNTFNIMQIICYISILLGKLKILHGSNIVHNDIKPANILVQYNDKNQIVDLSYIDYGETCLCDESEKCNTSGTSKYHPGGGNVLFYTNRECNLTYYNDIYSLGIIINDMIPLPTMSLDSKVSESNIKDDQLTTFVKDKMLDEKMYNNEYNIDFLNNLIKDFSKIFTDKLKECKKQVI
jgi:hypothetical protein